MTDDASDRDAGDRAASDRDVGGRNATDRDATDRDAGDRDASAGTRRAPTDVPLVAAFRPDDDRAERARTRLVDLDLEPVVDPMLAVEPTGATPPSDGDVVVFTSKTGAELVADAGWSPGSARVAAIGDRTAAALREAGYDVDVVPAAFSSSGLVDALDGRVDGARVAVARSDHGSDVLLEGLETAGADVEEIVLYELRRPDDAGESTELAAEGALDAVLFTSSLTVRHFLEAATERGIREAALEGLDDAVVAAIGDPTAQTARSLGIEVEVVPDTAEFDALARAAAAALEG